MTELDPSKFTQLQRPASPAVSSNRQAVAVPEETPGTPSPVNPAEEAQPNRGVELNRSLDEAVGKINEYVASTQRELRFSVDEATGKQVVQVVNQTTAEVVRQIPGDVALRLARNLNNLRGLQELNTLSVLGDPRAQAATSSLSALGLIDTRA